MSQAHDEGTPSMGVGAQPVVSPDLDASQLEGHAGPPSPEDEKTAHKGEDIWKAYHGEAPACFHQTRLEGEQWQVAWALKQVGVLPRGTPKQLKNKVRKGDILWGKRSGRTYYVYVHQSLGAERIERALAELEQIKARGPYRPGWHPLPKAYERHRRHPLKARSEKVLAHVLQEVGILKTPAVPDLHTLI